MKKIKCSVCKRGIVAHFTGKMISMKRSKERFTITGDNFNILATCPYCGEPNTMNFNIKNKDGEYLSTDSLVEDINSNNNEEEKKDEQKDETKNPDDGTSDGADDKSGDGKEQIKS